MLTNYLKSIHKAIDSALVNLKIKPIDFSIDYPPQTEFGQFSSNVAMVAAKSSNQSPLVLAEKIIFLLNQNPELSFVDHWQVAEPGFINCFVSDQWLVQMVGAILSESYQPEQIGKGQIYVLEYYQPNIAKPLHVGHIRSAILGDSQRRLLTTLGYKIISDTHMGDWGTQFGLLLYAYKQWGNKEYIEADPIPRLLDLYTKVNAIAKEDEKVYLAGKNEFVLLEQKDAVNTDIWQWLVKISMTEFMKIYDQLNLLPHDYHLPESFYEDKMPAVVTELERKNLIIIGESGEKYVDLEKEKLGRCIIIKSDGASTYHLRDLATYLYRRENFHFNKNIYFVDSRQTHHFQQLFVVLAKMGYSAQSDSYHAQFGFLTFAGNKLSTRSGDILKLADVMTEVENNVREILQAKGRSDVTDEAVKTLAVATLKFFVFVHDRKSDIDFTWDKVLSFEGKTGIYMLYTLARLRSIIRKASAIAIKPQFLSVTSVKEKEILCKLLITNDEIIRSTAEYSPQILAEFVYKLACLINSWYDIEPIINEPDEKIKSQRLAVVMAVEKTIERCLALMGFATVNQL